jgi:hypothetical protein
MFDQIHAKNNLKIHFRQYFRRKKSGAVNNKTR